MFNWIKKLFCRHTWNVGERRGGFIKGHGRIKYTCTKCGEIKYERVQ